MSDLQLDVSEPHGELEAAQALRGELSLFEEDTHE